MIRQRRYTIELLESRRLLSAPPLPTIGQGAWNVVTNFGAAGNGSADDTNAIQNALTAAKNFVGSNGLHGGIVTIPTGTYLCGPLNIYNNTELFILPGATLLMQPYGSSYFPPGQPTGSGTGKV